MRISDWSSDVCSSDLGIDGHALRRYPSAMADGFRAQAAALHGLTPEHVIATNGGDELLRLAITTYLEPGGPLGIAEPGYSLYPVLAALHDSPLARVELAADRSEETTSELQPIMRQSYAVLRL